MVGLADVKGAACSVNVVQVGGVDVCVREECFNINGRSVEGDINAGVAESVDENFNGSEVCGEVDVFLEFEEHGPLLGKCGECFFEERFKVWGYLWHVFAGVRCIL